MVARNEVGASGPSNVVTVTTLGEHSFEKCKRYRNKPCDVCLELLEFGLFKSACLECSLCGLALHKRCEGDVVAGCRGAGELEEVSDEDSDFLVV